LLKNNKSGNKLVA